MLPPVSQTANGPVDQALTTTINVINASTSSIAQSTKLITTPTATASGGPSTTDTKTTDAKTAEKKDDTKKDDADKQSGVKKDESKKMYCN